MKRFLEVCAGIDGAKRDFATAILSGTAQPFPKIANCGAIRWAISLMAVDYNEVSMVTRSGLRTWIARGKTAL